MIFVFPDKYVEMARQRGFDVCTVGQVMQEEGFVADAKDPHLSISGVSRREYLGRVVKKVLEEAER